MEARGGSLALPVPSSLTNTTVAAATTASTAGSPWSCSGAWAALASHHPHHIRGPVLAGGHVLAWYTSAWYVSAWYTSACANDEPRQLAVSAERAAVGRTPSETSVRFKTVDIALPRSHSEQCALSRRRVKAELTPAAQRATGATSSSSLLADASAVEGAAQVLGLEAPGQLQPGQVAVQLQQQQQLQEGGRTPAPPAAQVPTRPCRTLDTAGIADRRGACVPPQRVSDLICRTTLRKQTLDLLSLLSIVPCRILHTMQHNLVSIAGTLMLAYTTALFSRACTPMPQPSEENPKNPSSVMLHGAFDWES